jgi:parallel beta-helix repeat protein
MIEGNTAHHCSHGIIGYIHTAASSGNEVVVRGNECYSNILAGIMCRGNWWIIENNSIHHNGVSTVQAVGIWVISGSLVEGTGDHNIIRYNRCYNNTGTSFDGGGIALDQWCDNNDIYGNVCFANRSYGIEVLDVQFCNIYNNTCYGNATLAGMFSGEISINSSAPSPSNRTSDINIKNNIGYSTQASSVAVYIDANTLGGANIVFDNNIWFGTSTNWWTVGATGAEDAAASSGTSLATWNANSFVGTDLNVNPLFANVGSNDYYPNGASPAFATGYTALEAAQLLDKSSVWPSSVVKITNTRHDIGAYFVANVVYRYQVLHH